MTNDLFSSRELTSFAGQDLSPLTLPPRHFPERIVTAWRRFSLGLWRVPEGDISKAYCAETLPAAKTFVEDGQLFTNCGAAYSHHRIEADCYPLLPEGSTATEQKSYSYEGRAVRFQGKLWTLGPQVKFVSDEPTLHEWMNLFRSQYADGGYFAHQATYGDFLRSLHDSQSSNEREAREREIAGEVSSFSKARMGSFLDAPSRPQAPGDTQMNLF